MAETEITKSCFFITPIGSEGSAQRLQSDWIFEYLQPALAALGYDFTRADKVNKPNQITVDIFERVLKSDLCIVDLSFLNANVMYELGVRHMYQKHAILIAHAEWMDKLPFDTQNQRTISFEVGSPHSLKKLVSDVTQMIGAVEQESVVSNPLTHAIGSIELKTSGDTRDKIIADFADRLSAIERLPAITGVAPAIFGQGELATKNLADVQKLWRIDQEASDIDWARDENGLVTGTYKDFVIGLSPQSNGRWSSSARMTGTSIDIPYPRWQPSLDDAKAAVISAINEKLDELGHGTG